MTRIRPGSFKARKGNPGRCERAVPGSGIAAASTPQEMFQDDARERLMYAEQQIAFYISLTCHHFQSIN
jgi:hypothetical protein